MHPTRSLQRLINLIETYAKSGGETIPVKDLLEAAYDYEAPKLHPYHFPNRILKQNAEPSRTPMQQ